MPRKKQNHTTNDSAAQLPPCEVRGCTSAGEYKAPKSPDTPNQYQWLCLEHVREFNSKWDFFKGMSSAQIEAYINDAVIGHRPTWKAGGKGKLYDAMLLERGLYKFLDEPLAKRRAVPEIKLSPKQRKALADLELDDTATPAQIKTRYKMLVKKHHPDVNKGSKASEEKFKRITAAYKYLMQSVKTPV